MKILGNKPIDQKMYIFFHIIFGLSLRGEFEKCLHVWSGKLRKTKEYKQPPKVKICVVLACHGKKKHLLRKFTKHILCHSISRHGYRFLVFALSYEHINCKVGEKYLILEANKIRKYLSDKRSHLRKKSLP